MVEEEQLTCIAAINTTHVQCCHQMFTLRRMMYFSSYVDNSGNIMFCDVVKIGPIHRRTQETLAIGKGRLQSTSAYEGAQTSWNK